MGSRDWKDSVVICRVVQQRGGDLSQIALAPYAICGGNGIECCWENQARQRNDDRNPDQALHQSETGIGAETL